MIYYQTIPSIGKTVGALLYIATVSRPDIEVSVNILSRRNEIPRERDWSAVKRIIRHLKATAELKLIINKDKEPILTAFCDADWANDKSDRNSASGMYSNLVIAQFNGSFIHGS
ncbi:hypothetical protein AVEN_110954-1 [Araneus ventricosus]|uniref:Retrovirus-related Pol polyprotein from transposon TNT 1-94 n=1 Tax=Araneus ventricosus TaxID=182803 RepID=A0A4Y2HD94_ARAVE|nr:hypothetical protein AVEN_110954-1 [Araneus ventricosus]